MEPLVLEECGALLLRGNEDAEVMLSAPAVSATEAQNVCASAASPHRFCCNMCCVSIEAGHRYNNLHSLVPAVLACKCRRL